MDDRRHLFGRYAVLVGAVGLTAVLVAGCGGSSNASTSNTQVAGQLSSGEASGSHGGSSASTIPLAKQNSITALFTALSTFQSCLKGQGVTFIGIPNSADPNSPANNPSYIKALTTCAAQSNILQALKAEQTAQSSLTLAQIHTENKDYLKWRTCMIGKGWTIPTPTPNAQGLLFSFGAPGATGTTGSGASDASIGGFVPPAGQTILSTSDMQTCASKAIG
ncbi:MAG: hypothetical protein ABSG81_09870 [Acidimicrobiales bacterium]|jgi:hypothetical protein